MATRDDQSVDSLYDELVKAATTSDADTYAACFEENAVLMPPHAPVVSERASIREWAACLFETCSVEIATFSIEAELIVDRAGFRRYEASGGYTAKIGSDKTPFDQKYMDALARQPDGTWKLAAHMWNSNTKAKGMWD